MYSMWLQDRFSRETDNTRFNTAINVKAKDADLG